MNLKEDKEQLINMLTSEDKEIRKLAIDYIRNNYDINIIVPFFAEFLWYYDFEPTQTAKWQLSFIEEEYGDEFMVENLINAIIEHNKL